MAKRLVVDHAYTSQAYPNNIIVEVDGEYYLIPSRERTNNELSSFKKISKAAIEDNSEELPNYRYILKDLEKRSGYDITIGRAISKREFDELKAKWSLKPEDISEPFEYELGGIYGEKYVQRCLCIQIRVHELDAISIEKTLKKKGIEASSGSPGRVSIRIQIQTLKEFRAHLGMSQSEFATYFGLSVRNVQEWEQGNKSMPPYLLDLLERVWKAENK